MSSRNKKQKASISNNQEVEGLKKTVDSLLSSGKNKDDEIIITLNKMIKDRS
jgi:hypothetical protein